MRVLQVFLIFAVCSLVRAWNVSRPSIRLGSYFGFSGGNAASDIDAYHGLVLWVNYTNARGGIMVGNRSYTVELINYDSMSNLTLALESVQRLITVDQVDVIIGGSTTFTTAVAPYCESMQMINVQCCTGPRAIYSQGLRYIWGVHVPSDYYPILFMKSFSLKGITRIGLISSDASVFTVTTTAAVYYYASQFGMNIVSNATWSNALYQTNRTHSLAIITAELQAIYHAKVDLLMVIAAGSADGNDITLLIENMALEFVGVFITVAPSATTYIQNVGALAADYITSPVQWHSSLSFLDPKFNSSQAFVRLYNATYNTLPSYLSASGAAAGLILQLAIESAGVLQNSEISRGFLTLHQETFFGNILMDNTQRNVGGQAVLIQIINGTSVSVAPELYASNSLEINPSWNVKMGCPLGGHPYAPSGLLQEYCLVTCQDRVDRSYGIYENFHLAASIAPWGVYVSIVAAIVVFSEIAAFGAYFLYKYYKYNSKTIARIQIRPTINNYMVLLSTVMRIIQFSVPVMIDETWPSWFTTFLSYCAFLTNGSTNIWYLSAVLVISTMWVVCIVIFRSALVKNLPQYMQWILGPASILLSFVGDLALVPFMSTMMSTWTCLYDSMLQPYAFLESDCTFECWTPLHWGVALYSLFLIVLMIPCGFSTAYMWQHLSPRQDILFSKWFTVVLVLSHLLAAVSSRFQDHSRWSHGIIMILNNATMMFLSWYFMPVNVKWMPGLLTGSFAMALWGTLVSVVGGALNWTTLYFMPFVIFGGWLLVILILLYVQQVEYFDGLFLTNKGELKKLMKLFEDQGRLSQLRSGSASVGNRHFSNDEISAEKPELRTSRDIEAAVPRKKHKISFASRANGSSIISSSEDICADIERLSDHISLDAKLHKIEEYARQYRESLGDTTGIPSDINLEHCFENIEGSFRRKDRLLVQMYERLGGTYAANDQADPPAADDRANMEVVKLIISSPFAYALLVGNVQNATGTAHS
ncbi:periplasmic binding protein-like I [Polychytrium aggregatum]|uniref:periplasmic binding protein-like I n=1 Tax=Polychytrium aggregatum TaxID=110093 RepID=UPI0022FE2333|nr:periplasmic binding protein-like I [Polychytrium aggregatum]KAI9193355.1 periplasmic binding protein-like I [Polychytrium aggregatum]